MGFDFSQIDMVMIPGDVYQAILEDGISVYAFPLLAMIDHLSYGNTRGCIASNEELAEGIELAVTHTRKIIEQLLDRGVLVATHKKLKDHSYIRYLNTYWTEQWNRIPEQVEENKRKTAEIKAAKAKR